MAEPDVDALVASAGGEVRSIVDRLREVISRHLPDAVEEPDPSAKLIGYTYQPGTYKGLVVAIAPHTSHVNLMFSKGVDLLSCDGASLLEGTGKQARHIKFRDAADVDRAEVVALIQEAGRRTPRG